MKKVLIVTALAGFINTFLLNDIEEYKKRGYEVHCAANNNFLAGDNVLTYLEPMGVKFYDLEFNSKKPLSIKNFKLFKKIKRLLKKEQYNIIHCHTPIPGLYVRLAAKKLRKKGTKVIYTTHGLSFNKYSSRKNKLIYKFIESYLSRITDHIICINHEDYNELIKMKCENVHYLPSVGFDFNKYYSENNNIKIDEYRSSIGVSKEKIMVLSVGELSSRKNHQIIIKAISLLENHSDYVYVICGREILGSGTKDYLIKLSKDLDVNLILLGHRKDIPQIMKCSDIGAIPSIREGFGMAGVQSLAAGVPLVGSDIQGIKDYIVNEETGYLSSPFDEVSFAKNIEKLSDFSLRNEMKANCINMARKYDKCISYKKMEEIIDLIVGEK